MGFMIDCKDDNLKPISLRLTPTCIDYSDNFFFEISLPSYNSPGWTVFGVQAMTPPNIFSANNFSVLSYEPPGKGGKVIDGVTTIPGVRIFRGFESEAIEFWHGESKPMGITRVSLGFNLVQQYAAGGGPTFSQICIRIPPTFEHAATKLQDVAMYTPSSLPLFFDEELGIRDPRRNDVAFELGVRPDGRIDPEYVLIRLNEKSGKPMMIQGEHRIEFAVRVPTVIPNKNVFVLTVCQQGEGASANTTCTDPQSPRAITSFPFIGFNMGDKAKGTLGQVAGTIRHSHIFSIVLVSLHFLNVFQ